MQAFRIVPLPASVADEVRARRSDAFGNAELAPVLAEGSGLPCRVCLEEVEQGAEAFIFTHAALARPRPYRFIGPVAVHGRRCVPYAGEALPAILQSRLLSVRAFDAADELIEAEVVGGLDLEPLLERLRADSRVGSVHLHNARQGCYLCRLERV